MAFHSACQASPPPAAGSSPLPLWPSASAGMLAGTACVIKVWSLSVALTPLVNCNGGLHVVGGATLHAGNKNTYLATVLCRRLCPRLRSHRSCLCRSSPSCSPGKGSVIVYSATWGLLVAVTWPAGNAADVPESATVCGVPAGTPVKRRFKTAFCVAGAEAMVGV